MTPINFEEKNLWYSYDFSWFLLKISMILANSLLPGSTSWNGSGSATLHNSLVFCSGDREDGWDNPEEVWVDPGPAEAVHLWGYHDSTIKVLIHILSFKQSSFFFFIKSLLFCLIINAEP